MSGLKRICLLAMIIFGISPLKFNPHLIASIKAEVIRIDFIELETIDTSKSLIEKMPEKNKFMAKVQLIALRIEEILSTKIFCEDLSDWLKAGVIIEVRQPWLDQKPNFVVGDFIQAWVQYVSSSEDIKKPGQDAQWWFYDPEEKVSNRPPRHPFKSIKIIIR